MITLLLSFLVLAMLNLVVEALFYPAANNGAPAYADPDAPGVPVNGLRYGFAIALVVLSRAGSLRVDGCLRASRVSPSSTR